MTTRSIFNILLSVLLLISFLVSMISVSSNTPNHSIIEQETKLPNKIPSFDVSRYRGGTFTENAGQWDTQVYFSAITAFGEVWFGKSFIMYDLHQCTDTQHFKDEDKEEIISDPETHNNPIISGNILKINFECAGDITPIGVEPFRYRTNYFIGNDPSKWVTGVPNFRKVIYRNLWDCVDLVYYFNSDGLKYEFILHPGSAMEKIKLSIEGHNSLELDNNNLVIKIADDLALFDADLKIFYSDYPGEPINGAFKILDENSYTYELSNYDPSRSVVIDPLVYSTLIGSSDADEAWDIVIDSNNNSYITGDTKHLNFPNTTGAYDTTHNGNFDVVVFKLNPEGSALLYSTFIGGSNYDLPRAIDIDSSANVYITGYTESDNFPNTTNAFDKFYNDGYDIFVLKLNSLGSDLIYSTYIGGTDFDSGSSITVDPSGNAYVTGKTCSSDFPVSVSAFDSSHNGVADGFILKLNTTGSGLVYSTFIGGSHNDYCNALEIDLTGQAYVTGVTLSYNYPITGSGYNTLLNGDIDSFVTAINYWGTSLVFSTFIGGIDADYSRDIELDSNGNIYITGYTRSSDFPTSSNAYNDTFNGGYDVFITKFNPTGSTLLYSTFVGGDYVDRSRDIAIDSSGCAYVTGETYSKDFPSASSNESITDYLSDAFIFKLNSNGSALLYSTFISGAKSEYGTDLELDLANNAYVTGYTESSNFPTTNDSYDSFFSGGTDMFVLKFNFEYLPSAPVNVEGVGSNHSVHLTWEPPELPGVSDILGYKIYRGTVSDNLSPLTTIGSTTEYDDTDVVNLQTYYYRISALNTLGEGALSVEIPATPMPIPTPPRNLQALAGNNFINLFWDPPLSDGGSMILRYNIYRGNGSGNETYFDNVGRTIFLYNDTSVMNGETYYYFVKAENMYSESPPSQELEVTPEGPPSQPLELQANAGSGYVHLTWQPPANNGGHPIYGYVIYSSENPINLTFLVIVDELDTNYTDTSVTNGVKYFYYVVAVNNLGESPSSNLVNATPYGIPEPPEKPQGTPGLGYINITWEEPIFDGGKPIIEYRIYKYQVNSFKLLVILNNSTYSYQDKNVSSSYSYRYYLTSVNAFGQSEESELVRLSPLGPPFPPQQLYLTEDYGLLDIGWVPPAHNGGKPVTRYKIYRGTELGEEEFLDSISPFVTSYRDPNVSPNVTYYYYILAVNELGESEPSSTVSGMPWAKVSVSTPPLELQASAGNGYVNLSWSLPSDDGGAAITGYNIYRGTSPGNEVRLGFVYSHYKKFRDRNVINGLTYYYYIKAVNQIGESEPSDRVSATPMDTQKVNNSGDTDGIDLTLLAAWLIMIMVIFIILFMMIRKRRGHQSKKNIGKNIQKPDSTEDDKDKQAADSPIPPVDDSMHRLRDKNIDGPERFG